MRSYTAERRLVERQAGLYKPGKGFLRHLLFPHYGSAELDASYRHSVLGPFIDGIQQGAKKPRALDIGAGEGEATRYLRKSGVSVTPVDVNPVVLEDAEGVQAAAWRLPEAFTGGFEGAHMKDALVHVPTELRKEFFLEMSRVLKPGGILLICSAQNAFTLDLQYPASSKDAIAVAEQCGFALEEKTTWKPHVSAKDWYPRGLRKRFVLVLRKNTPAEAAGA